MPSLRGSFLAQLTSNLHEDLAEAITAAAVSPIAPVRIIGRVLDEFRVTCFEQQVPQFLQFQQVPLFQQDLEGPSLQWPLEWFHLWSPVEIMHSLAAAGGGGPRSALEEVLGPRGIFLYYIMDFYTIIMFI